MIIGIIGGSGAGKSTLTKELSKKIENSMVINVDDFMHKYLDVHKNEIIDALNLHNISDYWYNYLGINFDYIKTWVKIIENDIEVSIEQKMKDNPTINTFIVDWAFLPLLDFFNKCDYTISISCNLEVKLNRLKLRLAENEKLERWHDDALMNRLKLTSLNDLGYQAMYQIDNSGTLDDLNCHIEKTLNLIRTQSK